MLVSAALTLSSAELEASAFEYPAEHPEQHDCDERLKDMESDVERRRPRASFLETARPRTRPLDDGHDSPFETDVIHGDSS